MSFVSNIKFYILASFEGNLIDFAISELNIDCVRSLLHFLG